MVREFLESIFPRLRGSSWKVTSPATRQYNCIGWAAHDSMNWWWPITDDDDVYWPPQAEGSETVAAFVSAFAVNGYAECADEHLEPGFEKVAVFAFAEDDPSHVARQLPDGSWTSKLGEFEDIEHELRALEGSAYGNVVRVLKRPSSAPKQGEFESSAGVL